MSNVSTVSPYDTSVSSGPGLGTAIAGATIGLAAVCVVGAVVGTVALARWLSQETEEDRAAVARARERQRQERLITASPGAYSPCRPDSYVRQPEVLPPSREKIVSVALHLRNPETLVRTAAKLGYRVEPLPQPTAPQQQPYIRLEGPSGERLAIERTAQGQLFLHTANEPRRMEALVRQHTVDQVVQHLHRSGMQVRTAALANGETQILAQEQQGNGGGAAQIKAQIATDGKAWVDVDLVRGNRCEEIVRGIAQAMGGQVAGMKKKDAYFQLPGEPTRTRGKV